MVNPRFRPLRHREQRTGRDERRPSGLVLDRLAVGLGEDEVVL
jgi:hypothetical protein